MNGLIQSLTPAELDRLHTATMAVLKQTGVVFHDPDAVAIFRRHGIRTDGRTVFLDEKAVLAALDTVPERFTLEAFDPDRRVTVGTDTLAFAPGYGAPFVADARGRRRKAVFADYLDFCKLVHTSETIDVTGYMMVDPADLPPAAGHLDLLLANMTLSDKPYMGATVSREAARDAVNMARVGWGDVPPPVMLGLINSLAPLQYAGEMAAALVELARAGQAVIVTGGGMLGATAPIRVAGQLVQQNAQVLAGATLVQLVNPGTPFVYGVAGGPLDMRSGLSPAASPESARVLAGGAQMARYYQIPSRGGGSVCDAHRLDIQAGAEAALMLGATLNAGINYVLLACGMLGSYMAMNTAKFVIDEALCEWLRRLREPQPITDETIDLAAIFEAGAEGEFLTHPSTCALCRTALHRSEILRPWDHPLWQAAGGEGVERQAAAACDKRLAAYRPPAIDPALKRDLERYAADRKKALGVD